MATMLDERRDGSRSAHDQAPTSRTAVLLHAQPIMLEIIERLLEALEIETVSTHTTPDAALGAIGRHRPDAFILDLLGCDHSLDGVSSIREARGLVPTITAVAFADIADERQVAALLAAGAAVAVSRTATLEELAGAVRQVLGSPLPSSHAIRPTLAPPASNTDPGGVLTKREREILQLVAEGYSNDRVARHLWVTVQTVKFHLTNIYRKLDVANRTEAGRWAQRHGLLIDAAGERGREPSAGVRDGHVSSRRGDALLGRGEAEGAGRRPDRPPLQ